VVLATERQNLGFDLLAEVLDFSLRAIAALQAEPLGYTIVTKDLEPLLRRQDLVHPLDGGRGIVDKFQIVCAPGLEVMDVSIQLANYIYFPNLLQVVSDGAEIPQ